MNNFRPITFITTLALFLLCPVSSWAKEILTIYTYESFITEWGPGPAIKNSFEEQCDCQVDFVGLDSSIGILGRLQIEGED